MIGLIAFFVIGNLIATTVRRSRQVPAWANAPRHEQAMRLFWPTAIVAYLVYPAAR